MTPIEWTAAGMLMTVLGAIGLFLRAYFLRVEQRLYDTLDRIDTSSAMIASAFIEHEAEDEKRFNEIKMQIRDVHRDILTLHNIDDTTRHRLELLP